jgi:DNA-binding NtrC family response regulator
MRAAPGNAVLLLTGESGVGKHFTARYFHTASAGGSLVAAHGADLSAEVIERVWFRVADSEAEGVQPDGSPTPTDTPFLAEVTDLDLTLQARLAAMLEAEARLRAGSATQQARSVRVVAATGKNLRVEVQAGRFRDDLRRCLEQCEVHIPPLRDRIEDIPWLVADAVRKSGLPAHPNLVEACLLRPWPGNVRELLTEVRRTAQLSADASRKAVRAEDLDGAAGRLIASGELQTIGFSTLSRNRVSLPDHPTILAALRAESGNLELAARRLGMHHHQLRQYVANVADAAELVSRATGDDHAGDDPFGTISEPPER